MTNSAHIKTELRKKLRDARRAFVEELPSSVRNLVFMQPPKPAKDIFATANCVGAYVSTRYEAPTVRYIEYLHQQGQSVALPYFKTRDSMMEFREFISGDELVEGPFKILQPSGKSRLLIPDVLLIPLVGFTDRLDRLGQGGGHYDRYLSNHPDTVTIGLGWSVQLENSIPAEPHDHPMDLIITQSSFIERNTHKLEDAS